MKADYLSKAEFSRVAARTQELSETDSLDLVSFMASSSMEKFSGFAMKGFEPVVCTLDELAHLVGYQCLQFGGGLNSEELGVIWTNRRKFMLVGIGADDTEVEAAA